jgi:hypothetical protein
MHKKKNSENVLSGEMILTFYKPIPQPSNASPWAVRESGTTLFREILDRVLQDERQRQEFTSQYLFNRLILDAWRMNSLSELSVPRREFAEELRRRGWLYDATTHIWHRGRTANEKTLWDTTEPRLKETEA